MTLEDLTNLRDGNKRRDGGSVGLLGICPKIYGISKLPRWVMPLSWEKDLESSADRYRGAPALW